MSIKTFEVRTVCPTLSFIHFNLAMDSPAKSSLNPKKHLKEQFVSNLNGCSMLELFVLTSLISVVILVRRCICFHGKIDHDTRGTSLKRNDDAIVATKKWSDYMVTTSVDFLFVVLPMIIFLTVLSDWIYLNAVLLLVVLLQCVISRRYGSSVPLEALQPLRAYISSYRVTVMLLTCLSILAVDFRIFPRRYAKTETYGTSVMDLGVGAFVLVNSLVSRQARGILRTSLKNAMQSTSPLLFLGFARLVVTAGVNYQVHVGEYGVHWNFFFTLAAVSILTSIVNIPPRHCGILGSLILIGYQVCLMHGLNTYLLSDERGTDIVSQNKEGIYSIFAYCREECFSEEVRDIYKGCFSEEALRGLKQAFRIDAPAPLVVVGLGCFSLFFFEQLGRTSINSVLGALLLISCSQLPAIGYWGMYLVGVQLGSYLFFGNHSNETRANKWARIQIWMLALLFWLLTLFLDRHVERPSRRMCNLAYVTSVLAVNLQMLAILTLADYIPGPKISILEEAFNRNLLGTFLLANLMTGLVNLSLDTLSVSSVPAIIILSIYAFLLSVAVGVAGLYGFKLKFW